MDAFFVMFAIAVFIAVILLVEGLYNSWNSTRGPEARRIARRLHAVTHGGANAEAEVSIRKQRSLSQNEALNKLLAGIPQASRLDDILQQAGSKTDVGRFLAITCALFLVGAIVMLLLPLPAVLALPAGAFAASLPFLLLLRKRRIRLKRLEEQLPDALDLLCRALRAGHALPAGIQMIGDEMADPIAVEFRTVFDEVNFGISMQEALAGLARRVPGTDVGYFVVAVLIQRETGGNLTELLSNIASIVRDRLKLYGQVRALSAEGRLSAWILGLLPFVLAGIMLIVNGKLMRTLWTDPLGIKLIVGALVLMAFGIVWMRKVIRIRV
ncbi:type II secretion system F family protein [Noviherbaspirillum sp. ST9]|uniref:type II secretion system F family protein n=1 Tax=Noviherbaspirillum sp. ST9 TaxID=3401606 RepID=UPI003B5860F3